MSPSILLLSNPGIPSVRCMEDDALVAVVSDDPALLSDELYLFEVPSGQPLPTLTPSRPRDKEEEGEGDIKANIKAKPPAGFPLSGWARGGCGQACSFPSIKRG